MTYPFSTTYIFEDKHGTTCICNSISHGEKNLPHRLSTGSELLQNAREFSLKFHSFKNELQIHKKATRIVKQGHRNCWILSVDYQRLSETGQEASLHGFESINRKVRFNFLLASNDLDQSKASHT